jgi:triphosphoribosyl-dephospho-CoA synthase
MHADLFIDSAQAAAGPLFRPAARVGERIEAAVDASWAVARCNTNLGIVLLCAPIALAVEECGADVSPAALRAALQGVLAGLDRDDARAAYRAIARASPGGLGTRAQEDVRRPPGVDLRSAMALAAGHDLVARQYRDGYVDLFDVGLPALGNGFVLMAGQPPAAPDARTAAAVQRLFLALLSRFADSHIVRIHGEALAQTVMAAAQGWSARAGGDRPLDADPEFTAWDEALKRARINPGTSADLTVATLLLAGLVAPP